jgi:hypothetical protein
VVEMNSLDVIHFDFWWPFKMGLSEGTIDYLISLRIEKPISVYFYVPNESNSDDVGWASIQERRVFIRPTNDRDEFELVLAHEVTHIALIDQGYKQIDCSGDDLLGCTFANLLHHLVLYPRLIAGGFSLNQESQAVLEHINNRLKVYKEISTTLETQCGVEYCCLLLLNDLIRLDPVQRKYFLQKATKVIPKLITSTLNIMTLLEKDSKDLTVHDYINNKLILEYHLCLDTYSLI